MVNSAGCDHEVRADLDGQVMPLLEAFRVGHERRPGDPDPPPKACWFFVSHDNELVYYPQVKREKGLIWSKENLHQKTKPSLKSV
jgi:hypothetical protein